jgi:hypothetical protein
MRGLLLYRANIGNLSIAGGSYVVEVAAVSRGVQGLVQSITVITGRTV